MEIQENSKNSSEKNSEQKTQQSKEIKITGQLHPKCKAMFEELEKKGLI